MNRTDTGGESEIVIGELELTRALAIQMTAVGTLGLVVAWATLSTVYQAVTGQAPLVWSVSPDVVWWTQALDLLVVLFLGTVFVVPHEWLHGLAIRYYGGKPRYGVGLAHFILPYAYATTDHEFTRDQFIVVLLTPLAVMTVVGVPLMIVLEWSWLIVPLAANAGGAVADLWMTMTLLSYPPHVRLEDHEEGVRILGRESDRGRSLSVTSLVWDALAGAAIAAVGLLVGLAIGGPLVLTSFGVESFTIGTPGTITHLFAFTNTPTEISLAIGPGVLGVGALVGLAYAFVRSYSRDDTIHDAVGRDGGGH